MTIQLLDCVTDPIEGNDLSKIYRTLIEDKNLSVKNVLASRFS